MEFADFPALAHLNATQVENIRAVCQDQTLHAGESLMQLGESGGQMHFLLEGSVLVYVPDDGKEVEVARIQAPAVVGELEIFTDRPRTASVRALTDVRTMAIDVARVLARIGDGDPAVLKVMFALAKVVACRLVAITDKFVEIESSASTPRADELRAFRLKLFSEWS